MPTLADLMRQKQPKPQASGLTALMATDHNMIEPGNIDLSARPIVRNPDGTISTVRSISANFDGAEVLIPTVSDDGRLLPNDQAIQPYLRTGRHLGKFRTPEAATSYAQRLHEQQAQMYGSGR